MERIYDIKNKEVINVKDGCRLGYIRDVEFDLMNGRIKRLIIPAQTKILSIFKRNMEYHVNWQQVKRVGEERILVDVDVEKDLVEC